MKKLIINGRYMIHRVTGVERYAREIVSEFDRIIEPGMVEMAVPPEIVSLPKLKNIDVKRVGNLHNRKWEQISLPLYAMKKKGVLVNLCNVAPLIKPDIVCIHDVRIKATPNSFNRKFILWYNLLFFNAVKRAKKIITVSEFSKKEIMKYYNISKEKICVVPNAWQHYTKIKYDENALCKYNLEKDEFFFSMCSLEPNKNFKWIAEVARRNPDSIFAIAGSINKTVFTDGLGFDCPNNMKLLGYISDEEAKFLMKNCKAFLFPTFYEGFGIPPVEAICAGTKYLVVSDTEVMHEVLGDSANYINPMKYECKFDDLQKLRKKEAVLNKYSWKQSARLLLETIEEIINEPH